MKSTLEAIEGAQIIRTLDLTELDEGYRDERGAPLVLYYRVNPSRGQVRLMWELYKQLDGIRKENDGETTPEQEKELTARLNVNAGAWSKWWASIILTDDTRPGWLLSVERVVGKRTAGLIGRLIGLPEAGKPRYMRPKEIERLQQTGMLWNWIKEAITRRITEFEVEQVKKAQGGPTPAT